MKQKRKNVWKIRKGSALPPEISLIKDTSNPGHYMLAPAVSMPFSKYLGLLEQIATDRNVSVKLTLEEIENG